jgi:hypothetical protein
LPQRRGARPGTTGNGIRSVDFRNFDYPSGCLKVMGDGSNKLIHVIHGKWSTGSLKQANFVKFKVVNVLYGDVKGEGQEEAWVNLGP